MPITPSKRIIRPDVRVHVAYGGYRAQADLFGRHLVVIIVDQSNAPVMAGDDELDMSDPILRLSVMAYAAASAAMTARLYSHIATIMDGYQRPMPAPGPRERRRRPF